MMIMMILVSKVNLVGFRRNRYDFSSVCLSVCLTLSVRLHDKER